MSIFAIIYKLHKYIHKYIFYFHFIINVDCMYSILRHFLFYNEKHHLFI